MLSSLILIGCGIRDPWLLFVKGRFLFVFFFFSSRRRHTRCGRDWSSDVCSSDLLGLVGVWLLARLLIAFPMGLPPLLLLVIDLAFLPLAALALGRMVVAVRQWRNLVFVPILLLLAVANLAMHLGVMRGQLPPIREGGYLGVLLIATLMVLLGGRVIPFFTSRKLGRPKPADWPLLERLALWSIYAVVLLQLDRKSTRLNS